MAKCFWFFIGGSGLQRRISAAEKGWRKEDSGMDLLSGRDWFYDWCLRGWRLSLLKESWRPWVSAAAAAVRRPRYNLARLPPLRHCRPSQTGDLYLANDQSEWVSEWVSDWVNSECVERSFSKNRIQDCDWLSHWLTPSEWVSEWVSERVSESLSYSYSYSSSCSWRMCSIPHSLRTEGRQMASSTRRRRRRRRRRRCLSFRRTLPWLLLLLLYLLRRVSFFLQRGSFPRTHQPTNPPTHQPVKEPRNPVPTAAGRLTDWLSGWKSWKDCWAAHSLTCNTSEQAGGRRRPPSFLPSFHCFLSHFPLVAFSSTSSSLRPPVSIFLSFPGCCFLLPSLARTHTYTHTRKTDLISVGME